MSWRRVRILWILLWGLALGGAVAGGVPAAADEILVRGRVEARDGGALEEGRVRLLPVLGRRQLALDRLAGREPTPAAEGELRDDGRFEIAAPEAGMWWLDVEARDHLPMRLRLVPLVEETTLPRIELRRLETVAVRVLDPDGQPVPGAWVQAAPTQSDFWFSLLRDWRYRPSPVDRWATTDEGGAVTLPRAASEELSVRAAAPGLVESANVDTRDARVTLRLAAGRPLDVRAVDRRRSPLAGVLAQTGEGRWPAVADTEGRIRLTVPIDGDLPLRLLDPEQRWYAGSVAASVRSGPDPLELTLAEPRRLAGRVIDEDSRRPLAAALVWPTADPTGARVSDGRGDFTVTVDGDGEGEITLMAARSGYRDAWLQVAERSPHEPVLALRPMASVRGVVVDAGGRPVAEAEVGARVNTDDGGMRMVFRGGGEDPPRTVSDAEGRFLLTGLDPRRPLVVTASRDGFARGETELPELTPLATIGGVRVVLDTGVRLVGRVLDTGGATVAGARIVVRDAASGRMRMFRAMRGEDDEPPEAWSDNDGAFELAHLEAGTFDLEVSAQGFADHTVLGVELSADAGRVDAGTIVLEPGVELTGRVVDAAGRPLEGAGVRAAAANPMNRMRLRFGGAGVGADDEPEARSAADGHFALADRRPGERLDLVVRRSGYSTQVVSGIEVPPLEPVEVVLRPASSLSGKVVDRAGEPVRGARIQAFAEGGGAAAGGTVFMMALAGSATSDDNGEFTVEDIEPGTVRLGVSAQGFRATERSNIEVPSGEDVEGLEIELLPGASLAGRVRASDGEPITGARVHVVEQQRGPGRFNFGTRSDGAGAYFLDGLEPGIRLIGASHDDHGEVTREIEIEPGDNSLDLVFEGGVEVTGRVVDEGGAPLAGAVVQLGSATRFFRGGDEESTAADGSFTFRGVRDGSYRVTAFKKGLAQPAEPTAVEVAGAPVYGVEVRLAAGGVITGTIRGLDPARLIELNLYATSQPDRYLVGEVRHDGTYRIDDVGPGDWRVGARTTDGGATAEGRVTLDPGQPEAILDLEFGAGPRVTGRVMLAGEPLAGVNVGLRGLDVRSDAAGVTARDGRFTIEGIEPGRHRLTVMDFGSGLQHSEEHLIRGDVDLLVELRLSRVSGRVLDAADASPVDGAVVRLDPLDEQDDWGRFLNRGGSTDAAGLFSVHNVSAGAYRLRAEKDGYAPGELTIQVSADRYLENLEVSLQPTDGLTMRVLLPSGGTAGRVSAAVLDGAGVAVVDGEYRADQEGRVRLSKVPPGSWTVLVGGRGSGVARVAAVAPGDAGVVRLPPEARLDVVIPELADDPALVTVEALGGDGRPARRFTWSGRLESFWRASFGRATLTGLAPGTWRIRATAPDGRVWEETVALAPGVNPTLELR